MKNGAALVKGRGYAYVDGMNLTGIRDQVVAPNSNTQSYSAANLLADQISSATTAMSLGTIRCQPVPMFLNVDSFFGREETTVHKPQERAAVMWLERPTDDGIMPRIIALAGLNTTFPTVGELSMRNDFQYLTVNNAVPVA